MEKIVTGDGSVTFYCKKYKQAYHSDKGAFTEAVQKFVGPCEVEGMSGDLYVLDICFGLGYNTAALLDAVSKNSSITSIRIDAFENDPEILSLISTITTPFEHFEEMKELLNGESEKFEMHLGDVLVELDKVPDGRAQIVFFDAFSEPVCPQLWTAEFLSRVFSKMASGGKLTTYSCARKIRDNLRSAGFIVKDGPIVNRRGPSTIAIKPCL